LFSSLLSKLKLCPLDFLNQIIIVKAIANVISIMVGDISGTDGEGFDDNSRLTSPQVLGEAGT
jgi:hypothetical protein